MSIHSTSSYDLKLSADVFSIRQNGDVLISDMSDRIVPSIPGNTDGKLLHKRGRSSDIQENDQKLVVSFMPSLISIVNVVPDFSFESARISQP